MKNRISAWIVLGVITIVAGLGLAFTNEVTKGPIDQQAIMAKEKAKIAVMPEAASFSEIALADGSSLFEALSDTGEVIGYVGQAQSKGYGGMIEVITGVKTDGTITGINVGGSSFAETPGLGAKAKDAEFTSQFAGKQSPVRLGDASAPNAVDSITAATRTSNAVLGAVNEVAKKVNLHINPDAALPTGPAEGTAYAGEGMGFAAPVYVVVTVKDDGTISGLSVGDERFAETEGYGAAALSPDFGREFIGKRFPLSLRKAEEAVTENNIDGISGATVTTNAVLLAANQAFESQNILLPEGTTYAGEAEGFGGPVAVEVTIKEDASITALKIGDDRFNETEGYGAPAREAEFVAQFIGKTVPLSVRAAGEEESASKIDGISGATMTTNAVLSAINSAYEFQNIIAEGAPPKPTAEPTAEPVQISIPADALTAAQDGYAGPVAVALTFDADGKITFLHIGDERFDETRGFGLAALEPEFQAQFIGKLPPLVLRAADEATSEHSIDGISGATLTNKAVLGAINELYTQQFGQPEPGVEPTAEPVVDTSSEGITITKQGFMGPVSVTASFDKEGRIQQISISPDGFVETPGYGALALEEGYAAQFAGKQAPLTIRVLGEQATDSTVENLSRPDTATSATATAQAIVDAVNEAYNAFLQQGHAVTKQGFMGPVTVTLRFDADGKIEDISIGGEGFAETPGYGALALEEAFAKSLIGKLPPLRIRQADEPAGEDLVNRITNPDTTSSATTTTQAIIDAINEAFNNQP